MLRLAVTVSATMIEVQRFVPTSFPPPAADPVAIAPVMPDPWPRARRRPRRCARLQPSPRGTTTPRTSNPSRTHRPETGRKRLRQHRDGRGPPEATPAPRAQALSSPRRSCRCRHRRARRSRRSRPRLSSCPCRYHACRGGCPCRRAGGRGPARRLHYRRQQLRPDGQTDSKASDSHVDVSMAAYAFLNSLSSDDTHACLITCSSEAPCTPAIAPSRTLKGTRCRYR